MKSSNPPIQKMSLGESTEFILDGTHGSPTRTPSGIPVLSATNVKGGQLSYTTDRFTSDHEYEAYRRRLNIRQGDVLLTIVGTIGRTAVVEEIRPHIFQRSVAVLRPKEGVLDSRFLFHALNTTETSRQLAARTNQSAQAGVYLGALKEVVVPVPPLAEQRRIADILDKADAIRRKRQEAIRLTEDLLRSTFLEMFGDPVTNPKGWPIKPLGNLLAFLTSGSRGWAQYYSDAGETFLRIQNVRKDRLDLSDVAYVHAPESAETKRTSTQPGDVLLSITADLGRTAVIPNQLERAFINQHLAILRPKGIYPEYLSTFLASNGGQRQINERNKGGVKAGLNFDDIRSIKIPVPSESAQKAFTAVKHQIRQIESNNTKALQHQNDIFQSLVTSAFSKHSEAIC